jgi:ParB family chromosome partitioning protein
MTEEFENLREELSRQIGAEAKIACSPRGGGKITIPFKDADDLRRLVSLFKN